MTEATVCSLLSADGLLARSSMISCQRFNAACLPLRPWASFSRAPLILTYHQPSERRNQGCARRAMIDPPNPRISEGNTVVDWKGPLQHPARLVPERDASIQHTNAVGKVQRKVQHLFSLLQFLFSQATQVLFLVNSYVMWAIRDSNL